MSSKCPTKPQLIELLMEARIRRHPDQRGYEDDVRAFVRNHIGPRKSDLMLAAVNAKLVPSSCWSFRKRGS
jgi:hypothetical protein